MLNVSKIDANRKSASSHFFTLVAILLQYSVSPTKLWSTLPVNNTGSYTQLLHITIYAI